MRKTFFVLFLIVALIFVGGSYSEQDCVSMSFSYNGKSYVWNDSIVLDKTKVFTNFEKAQKNGRMSNHKVRADLIERIHQMGFSYEDAFDYTFLGLREIVDKIKKDIDTPVKDATVNFNPNRKPYFFYQKEQTGFLLEKEKFYADLLERLKKSSQINIKIEPKIIRPEVTKEMLINQTKLKSRFETNYASSSQNRKSNIELAMKQFNGLVLQPDVEYSFNETTGRRTKEKGYKQANIILNNEYTEAFGGGVCQVSTTLYNALLLAGVEILEVHPHSLASSYVQMGFDAMVNFGSSDLRFKNNFQHPIYLRTYANGQTAGVEIYGFKEGNALSIKRANEIVSEIAPPFDKIIEDDNLFEDESFYKTYSKKGYKVKSYLEYYNGDELISKKLIRTQSYKAVQGVRVVGTKKRPPEPEIQEEPQGILQDIYSFLFSNKQNNSAG